MATTTKRSRSTRTRATPPTAAVPVPLRAMQLLGRWTRASQGHLLLGAGCMCVGGFGAVSVADLEVNVFDYLAGKYGSASAVVDLLRSVADYREGETGSLPKLLQAIARQASTLDTVTQGRLLDDLERTIESFGAQHGA